MRFTNKARAAAALAACVAVGVVGGIAGSMAAPSKSTTKKAAARSAAVRAAGDRGPGGHHGGPGGRAVHSEEVVLNKAGTAFVTETEDNGKVKSVSGNDVTITEGTGTVTYKDVTVTIASGAKVTRNGATAAVSDLKAGDNISVSSSSDGTTVFAFDSTHQPMHGPGDGDGPGRHGGTPPAAAPTG
jgi:hypothetical protein